MARKKKYVALKKLGSLSDSILSILELDIINEKKYAKRWYTVTTNGGKGILWQVNECDGTVFTISTDILRRETSGRFTYPVYGHYVLTTDGIQWIKETVVEQLV
jgi:hypothetical protein